MGSSIEKIKLQKSDQLKLERVSASTEKGVLALHIHVSHALRANLDTKKNAMTVK